MADYLKIPELADRLDVSEKTARTYVKGGVIPSAFIGGAYRVSEEDLEAFVESRRSKPQAGKAVPRQGPGRPSDWLFTTEELEGRHPRLRESGLDLLAIPLDQFTSRIEGASLVERAGMLEDLADEYRHAQTLAEPLKGVAIQRVADRVTRLKAAINAAVEEQARALSHA